jgi:predicted N-formylglutamate amidohydrolase
MSFQIVPGDPASTVIVHVPHASREIPDEVRAGLLLDDEALERELDAMTDAFTDVVAQLAADSAGVRPWVFVNRLSRLVVDPERFPDEREEMNAVGMGAAYIRTCEGFNLRHDPTGLVEKYFDPYSCAFSELLDERMDAVASVTIIDVHSFPRRVLPYELHGDGPRPEICLGTDQFHTPRALLDEARRALWPVGIEGDIAVDTPFSGCYVPLHAYRLDRMVQAIMVEVRRDLITLSPTERDDRGIGRVAHGLATLIDRAATLAPTFEHPHGKSLARAVGVAGPSLLSDAFRVRFGGDLVAPLEVVDHGDHLLLRYDGMTTRHPYPISVHEIENAIELLDDPTLYTD